MEIIFLIWLISLFVVILTSYRVWGLRGGYGKGTWGGFYMWEALDNRRRAWAAFIVVSILLVSLLFINNK